MFVPVVVSTTGLNGAFFTTELSVTNRGLEALPVRYEYTAAFGGEGGTAIDVLAPGEQRIVMDAIEYLGRLGVPTGPAGNRGGTLRVTFAGRGAVTARTSTAVPGGRAGLAYAGLSSVQLLDRAGYICGLRQDAMDRSNIAIANAGSESDGPIALRLTVFSGDPANPHSRVLPDVTLAPGHLQQVSGVLASNGLDLTNGYVRVERLSGSAPFTAYGAINDQANSDGSFVPPVPADVPRPVTRLTVPALVETPSFSSELIVTNLTSSPRTLHGTWVASALSKGRVEFDLVLLPHEQQVVPAFVQVLRERGIVSDPAGAPFAGSAYFTDSTGDLRGVFIGSRTSTAGGVGRYGVFSPAVPAGSEAASTAWLYGLRQDTENRSNVAVVVVGSVDSAADTFRIQLFDGATGRVSATRDCVSVPADGLLQLNGLLSDLAPGTSNGYVVVTRTSGNNPFIAYGVINDGGKPGERSGDGAFIEMSEASVPVSLVTEALLSQVAPLRSAPRTDLLTLSLPNPVGTSAFMVTTRNGGIAGPVTVTADSAHVPLPALFSVCPVDPDSGRCLAPATESAPLVLVPGESSAIKVFVTALGPIPEDATFHRAWVYFRDGAGNTVGTTSVAIQNAAFGRQTYIDRGGTYTGSWTNDDIQSGASGAGGNAVYIATTEPVVLESCFIRSTKELVHAVEGAHVTIRNCNGYGLDPGEARSNHGFFFFALNIGSLTMEHNYLEGMAWGAALWGHPRGARWTPDGRISIRYNKVRNLDGLEGDGRGGRVATANPNANPNGFVSIAELNLSAGAEIAWNEVTLEPFVSATGDIVDLWASPGTSSAPVEIHDNLFHGQYAPIPTKGNGPDPPGCTAATCSPNMYGTYVAQVITPDGSPSDTVRTATSFLRIHHNQVVSTWGGISATVGHDNEIYENRVACSGALADGTWVSPNYGGGMSSWDAYNQGPAVFFNNVFRDNAVGFLVRDRNPNDPSTYVGAPYRSDYAFSGVYGDGCSGATASKCTNNVSLPDPITSTTEVGELFRWRQKRAAAGVTVGSVAIQHCPSGGPSNAR